jgi:rubrerythrin
MTHKLDSCIKLEIAIGETYLKLSKMFPEARELFDKLAIEEINHAEILTKSKELNIDGELSEEFVNKLCSMVTEPLVYVQTLKHKIEKKQLSLEEALNFSLKIEQHGAEYYLQATMLQEVTDKAISLLQQLYKANRYHADVIREFMTTYLEKPSKQES